MIATVTCPAHALRDDAPCELAAGHAGPHRSGKRSWSADARPRRTFGASGRTLSRAQRRARGDVEVAVWLAPDDARLLADLEARDPGDGARTRVVRRAIRAFHAMGGSGSEA